MDEIDDGTDIMANAIMTCNYLPGRESHSEATENALFLPPSCAIAGKLYTNEIHKSVNHINVNKLRFDIKESEVKLLERLGLISLSRLSGNENVFSFRTLYSGENKGLRMYPAVRVFDWLTKVFIDFFNNYKFENWDFSTQEEIIKRIKFS